MQVPELNGNAGKNARNQLKNIKNYAFQLKELLSIHQEIEAERQFFY